MKAKNENKEEKEVIEPFDNSYLGQGAGDMTSVDIVLKPTISSDMDVEGSVLNQMSIDTGLVMEEPKKPIPIMVEPKPEPIVVLDKVEEQNIPKVNIEKSEEV